MKRKSVLTLCVILLVLSFLCTGCSKAVSRFEDEELRQYTATMLDALIANDVQAAYAPVKQHTTLSEFSPIFDQMRDFLGKVDTYELQLLSIYTNVKYNDGQKVSCKDAVYEMRTGGRRIIISVGSEAGRGLVTFRLSPYESTDYYATGTLTSLAEANLAQIALLLSNIVPLGLTVWAFVDCVRRKVTKKLLWFLLLSFGFITVGATLSETRFMFNFNISGFLGYSALIRYGSGTTVFRLLVPVGAIAYLIDRFKKAKLAPQPTAEAAGEVPPAQLPCEECTDPTQPPVEEQK